MKFHSPFLKLFSVLLIFVAILISCSKESKIDVVTVATLAATTNSSIPNTATNQFLAIQSNGQWKITVNYISGGNGWVTLSATSGTGDTNIILQISQNTSADIRSVELQITSGDKEVKLPS